MTATLLLWVACCGPSPSLAAEPTSFALERSGEVFTVRGSALIATQPEAIWQVVTDYDDIANFVPGFSSSRVIESSPQDSGRELLVEQKGAMGPKIFPLDFTIQLRVVEFPYRRIEIERVSGSARQYRAVYQIEPVDAQHTRLDFDAVIESDRFIPPWLGTSLMRSTLADQFGALVREIERREGIRTPPAAAPEH